jgi:hypothetical protein
VLSAHDDAAAVDILILLLTTFCNSFCISFSLVSTHRVFVVLPVHDDAAAVDRRWRRRGRRRHSHQGAEEELRGRVRSLFGVRIRALDAFVSSCCFGELRWQLPLIAIRGRD